MGPGRVFTVEKFAAFGGPPFHPSPVWEMGPSTMWNVRSLRASGAMSPRSVHFQVWVSPFKILNSKRVSKSQNHKIDKKTLGFPPKVRFDFWDSVVIRLRSASQNHKIDKKRWVFPPKRISKFWDWTSNANRIVALLTKIAVTLASDSWKTCKNRILS